MRIELEITQEDIDDGKPTADACPIAISASRTLKRNVQVYYSFFRDRKKGWLMVELGEKKYGVHRLPTAVAVWAEAFDRTSEGAPFTFTLESKGP
jgi:hypothetical protein